MQGLRLLLFELFCLLCAWLRFDCCSFKTFPFQNKVFNFEYQNKSAKQNLNKELKKQKRYTPPFLTILLQIELKELETLEARGELRVRHLSESEWTKFKETFTYDTPPLNIELRNRAQYYAALQAYEKKKTFAQCLSSCQKNTECSKELLNTLLQKTEM